MANIVICDDDRDLLDKITKILRESICFHEVNVHVFEGGKDLLDAYGSGHIESTDLLILDIEMDISGLDVMHSLQYNKQIKRIIFLSSHRGSIPVAYGLKVMGFITKPVDEIQFTSRVQAILDELYRRTRIEHKGLTFIFEELLYIDVENVYSQLHFINGKSSSHVRESMDGWLRVLPDGLVVRVSGNYLINLMYTVYDGKESVRIFDKVCFEITRTYKKKFKELYQEYQLMLAEKEYELM